MLYDSATLSVERECRKNWASHKYLREFGCLVHEMSFYSRLKQFSLLMSPTKTNLQLGEPNNSTFGFLIAIHVFMLKKKRLQTLDEAEWL